jgi:hypothetical protein
MSAGTESVAQVQARIAQIEARFAMRRPAALAASSSDFAASLAGADATFRTAEVGSAQVVQAAVKYLGVPYQWGGTDPATGLDCSGFVQRVYGDLGIELPRVSRDQAKAGRPVADLASAQPGDLIAFDTPVDHIGIYLGNNRMIVAPRTGDVVKVQDVPGDITAIRRILPDTAGTGAGTTPFDGLFDAAGIRHGISSDILRAVACAESGFRTDAVSPAGAQGLMQLMPGTAKGLGVNPFDPAQAIDGAAGILAGNLRKFGSLDKALAAYNAGAGAVQRYGGVPPYAETQSYVRRILTDLRTEAP